MDFSNFIKETSKELKTPESNRNNIELVNLKRGMMVRIIYKEGSPLNSYKGYLGEIISCNKQKKVAKIFLHPSLIFKMREFPLDHFKLIDT